MTEESKQELDALQLQTDLASALVKPASERIFDVIDEYRFDCQCVGITFIHSNLVAANMLIATAAAILLEVSDDRNLMEGKSEEYVSQVMSDIIDSLFKKLVTDVTNIMEELNAKQASETVSGEQSEAASEETGDDGQHGDVPTDATGAGNPEQTAKDSDTELC